MVHYDELEFTIKYASSRGHRNFSGRLSVASLAQAVLAFLCAHADRSYYGVEVTDEAARTLTAGGLRGATIQTYYSVFHSARALLYTRRCRERSHRRLVIALRELYVGPRLLELEFVEGLAAGKTLRENPDYYSRFSEAGSHKTVELAGSFLARARVLAAETAGPM